MIARGVGAEERDYEHRKRRTGVAMISSTCFNGSDESLSCVNSKVSRKEEGQRYEWNRAFSQTHSKGGWRLPRTRSTWKGVNLVYCPGVTS